MLSRTDAAVEAGLPALPPPPSLPRDPAPAQRFRLFQPIWLLGWLPLLAASVGSTWLVTTWLNEWVAAGSAIPLQYMPDLDDLRLSTVILAAAWTVVYAFVAPASQPVRWHDAWGPPVTAYRDLLTPGGVAAFGRGLLAAVPVNVLLVGAAACAAGALAYSSSGSTDRDNVFRLVFVLLAAASLVRYVTRSRSARGERG